MTRFLSTLRSGQNTYLAVFVILAAALTATGWYQAQTTLGQQQAEIFDQTEIDISQANIDNAVLFIQTSLGVAAAQASGSTAELSGRSQEEDPYRYWLCDGEAQTPDVDVVRDTASSFTQENMEPWLDEVHGEQDQWFQWVGPQECAEIGYREPMDDPDNDNFLAATHIDGLNITHQNGTMARGDDDVQTNERVAYNRFWYVYETTTDWVENEDIEESVLNEVQEVPDIGEDAGIGCGDADCPQEGPFWLPEHPSLLEGAVSEGIENKIELLEEDEEYFDGHDVECDYEYKEGPGGEPYPGWNVEPTQEEPTCEKEAIGGCGTCVERRNTCVSYDGDDDAATVDQIQDSPSPPPPGPGGGGGGACGTACTEWTEETIQATSSMGLHFDVWFDATVECTDHRFLSVPEEDLEPVTWRFDISGYVEDHETDNEFTCPDRASPCPAPFDSEPHELRECEVEDDTPDICESGVNVIERTE